MVTPTGACSPPTLRRGQWHLFVTTLTFLVVVLISPSVVAQPGDNTIYVPGKEGIRSAPTVQAAIDMASGPTEISVSLPESPGFAASEKNVGISFGGTKVTGSMTFDKCSRASVSGFKTTALIAFTKSKNIQVQLGEAASISIEDSELAVVFKLTITGGLHVTRSTGVAISQCSFTGEHTGVIVKDSTKSPPAEFANSYGPHTVLIQYCEFRKTAKNIPVMGEGSRVVVTRNTFADLGYRGIQLTQCRDAKIDNNTFNKVGDVAILFFDSEGVVEYNKIAGIKAVEGKEEAKYGTGIDIVNKEDKSSLRPRVTIKGNEIYGVEEAITTSGSTINITGNLMADGLFGIIASSQSDGSLSGNTARGTKMIGLFVLETAPGFLVETNIMESVEGFGLLVAESKQVMVKNNHWTARGETSTTMMQPVRAAGMQIENSEVTLENNSVGGDISGVGLAVLSGSTVTSSSSIFTSTGQGRGIVVDGSTLAGSISSHAWQGTALHLSNGAKVTLSGAGLASGGKSAIVLEGGSSLDLTDGVLNNVVGPTYQGEDDIVSVTGQSKIRLTRTSISLLNKGRVGVRLAGRSEGVFNSCEIHGNRAVAPSSQYPNGKRFEGSYDGLLVEGEGSKAEFQNGLIYVGAGDGVRVRSGGQVTLTGTKFRQAENSVRVESGGSAEIQGCMIQDDQALGENGVRVDAGGQAKINNSTLQRNLGAAVWVAQGGKCEVYGSTLKTSKLGIKADPGATVVQSGNQFSELTTNIEGDVRSE